MTHAPLQRVYPLLHVKVHALPTHAGAASATLVEHALPHMPQLPRLVAVSTHAPLQRVYPLLHVKVHALSTHAAVALATRVEHALPHMPQLPGLVIVSTHVPLHSVGVDAGQPERHEYASASNPASPPGPHTGVLPVQALPQLPQLVVVS